MHTFQNRQERATAALRLRLRLLSRAVYPLIYCRSPLQARLLSTGTTDIEEVLPPRPFEDEPLGEVFRMYTFL
jgi:hypothetical protein